jgi:hypothetical protein
LVACVESGIMPAMLKPERLINSTYLIQKSTSFCMTLKFLKILPIPFTSGLLNRQDKKRKFKPYPKFS